MHKYMRKTGSEEDYPTLKAFLQKYFTRGQSSQVICSLLIQNCALELNKWGNWRARLELADCTQTIYAEIADPSTDLRKLLSKGRVITTRWELKNSWKNAPMLHCFAADKKEVFEDDQHHSWKDVMLVADYEKLKNQRDYAQTIDIPYAERWRICYEIAESMTYEPLRRLFLAIMAIPGVLNMPAAIGNHHPEEGGYFKHAIMQILKNLQILTSHTKDWPNHFEDICKVVALAHDLAKCIEYQFDQSFRATESTYGNFAHHIPRSLRWVINWNMQQHPKEQIDPDTLRLVLDMMANHHGGIQMPKHPATAFAYDVQHGIATAMKTKKDMNWQDRLGTVRPEIKKAAVAVFQKIENDHYYPEFVNFAASYPQLCREGVYEIFPAIQEAMLIGALGVSLSGKPTIGADGTVILNEEPYKFTPGICKYLEFWQIIESRKLHKDPDVDSLIKEAAANIVLSSDVLDGVELQDPQNSVDWARIYAHKADWISFTHERHMYTIQHDYTPDIFPERGDPSLNGNRVLLKDKAANNGKDLFIESIPKVHAFMDQKKLTEEHLKKHPQIEESAIAEEIKDKNFIDLN